MYLCKLYNISIKNAETIALTLENLHQASLIHDDIQDEDEIRRSFKTIWTKESIKKALLVGDMMIFESIKTLLNLENTSIETDKAGRIVTDHNLQTAETNIYAIGDVVKGAMLAHKAEEEGVYVAELIADQKPHLNYNLIPGVVYTWPEVAAVGKTEQELKDENINFKVGQFPIRALGRARASMDIQGLIKIISDQETDEVLGVHMIAPRAADLIMEAVVAMEYRASAEDIARICHPHPTYSEAVKEAALSATAERPIHI